MLELDYLPVFVLENVALLAIPSGSAQSGESTNGAVANGKSMRVLFKLISYDVIC